MGNYGRLYLTHFLTQASTIVVTLVTFGIYDTIEGKPLTADEVFSGLALFGQLAVPLFIFPTIIPIIINAKVSVSRLSEFLTLDEVSQTQVKRIDLEGSTILEFEADSGSVVLHVRETKPDKRREAFRDSEVFLSDSDDDLDGDRNVAVEITDANFTWDAVSKNSQLRDVNLSIPAGKLTMIVGSVGSGKSSLLSAMLGEMLITDGSVKWSRTSPVAYVPQKPWLINATLKENILFGQQFDVHRYNRVLSACALQQDLDVLPAGDLTEIGEKGVNLSGGQKQRIAVARALYSRCKTLLLDDPLSALDAQVALHVFEEGINKLLLRYKRTTILVTHRLQFLPSAAKVIYLDNGTIKHQGSLAEIETCNPELSGNWKATRNREEKECTTDGVHSAKGRWKLLRNITLVPLQRSLSIKEHSRQRPFILTRQISCDASVPMPLDDITEAGSMVLDDRPPYSVANCRSNLGSLASILGRSSVHRLQSEHSNVSSDVTAELDENQEEEERLQVTEIDGKLIMDEKREHGHISWRVYAAYARACGGILSLVFLGTAVSTQASNLAKDFWLSEWTEASKEEAGEAANNATKEGRQTENMDTHFYLGIYAALSLLGIGLSLVNNVTSQFAGLRAQRILHASLINNIVRSPMRFFDSTPVGRILNRFSIDIGVLDKKLQVSIQMLLRYILLVISVVIVNATITPIFLAVALPIAIIYYFVQHFFRASAREMKRLDSITKSPQFSHFSETLSGLTTIRAFRDESRFTKKLLETVNLNNLVFLMMNTANRWLAIALDYVGASIMFLTTMVSITSAISGSISASFVGLAMVYTMLVPVYLNWLVRSMAEMEMYMSGVERIQQYAESPPENYDQGLTSLSDSWPNKGEIKMEAVSLRYNASLDPVVSKISVVIKPGQKVGICGRTGSGKSSLTLGLFRMMDISEGHVYIDEVDISHVPLLALRSRLAIVPQDAVLFTGSIRLNLDPEENQKDEDVWEALEMAQLKETVQSLPQGLATQVSEGGENFSVGQRQLFCLARAILRPSRIVVMDEATASLDEDTDQIVQKVMAKAFVNRTVITIAHRISTILNYDTILVLDAGKIVESGSPVELLQKPESIFSSLVKANK